MTDPRGLDSISTVPILKRIADRRREGYVPDPAYSPPPPDCDTCGDTGWVGETLPLGATGFGAAKPCPRCGPAPRPIAPEGMTFEAFNTYGDHPNDYKLKGALKIATAFAAGDWPVWVTFLGSNGSGKTHLAYAMAQARRNRGERVAAVRSSRLLAAIFAAMGDDTPGSPGEVIESYSKIDVVLLDELGREGHTEASLTRISEILNERYVERLPTIITTNWSLEAIGKVWPDVASRMADSSLGAIVDLEGVLDHRKRG